MTSSRLDVAFFGSSLVSAYWNGAATYYRGIVRALAERGHRVTFYEPDAYGRQQHRDMPDPEWARVVVYAGEGEDGVLRALEQARGANLVVKASGVGVFDELLERAVLELQRPDTLVAFWDVDAPATLDRVRQNPADPFLPLVPRYDLVLTYGGGDPVVDAYEALGARACVPVYNALDPATHHPVPPEPRFEADLGFLGNRLPDREARVEEFFLRAAALLPDRRFLLGGNGWQDKAMPANVGYLGHVYTHEHNAFNCTPRAVLELQRPETLVVFWDVDAPATLDRVQRNPADPFLPLVPRYDLVLTYGGGDPVVAAYAALGARECVPVYNALDPATHHPVPPEPRFEADLGFLGNRLPDREARVEEFFLRVAALLPGRRFLLGGNGWKDKALPPNVGYLGHVYTHEHNAFNCTPRAVLNVNRESMARYGFSPPTRVFEAAGAGACLITDEWVGVELFLEPGREVLVAGDGAQVAEHLAALTPARARAIGEAAYRRVLAEHTYGHRAALVEEVLQGRGTRDAGRGAVDSRPASLVPRPSASEASV